VVDGVKEADVSVDVNEPAYSGGKWSARWLVAAMSSEADMLSSRSTVSSSISTGAS